MDDDFMYIICSLFYQCEKCVDKIHITIWFFIHLLLVLTTAILLMAVSVITATTSVWFDAFKIPSYRYESKICYVKHGIAMASCAMCNVLCMLINNLISHVYLRGKMQSTFIWIRYNVVWRCPGPSLCLSSCIHVFLWPSVRINFPGLFLSHFPLSLPIWKQWNGPPILLFHIISASRHKLNSQLLTA